jgi:multiple sugar transport system substrate-binding protein
MKYVFAGVFATLLLLSGIAALWRPHHTDYRIPLVWATDDAPVRREQIALFNKLHPSYRLTLDPVSGPGAMEKIIVQSLAGAGPDIFDCYSQFQLALYVRSGIALNLTETLAARGIHKEDAWECLWPLVELDGNLYGFPGNGSGPAMWYNKRIFREAGLPYPNPDWTWDECIAIAQRLTRRDRQGRPVQFGLMLDIWEWRTVLLAQYGGNIYSPEGTRCTLDAPEACAAAQAYQDLMFRHGVSPNYAEDVALASTGGWGTGVIARFGAGLGAMAMGGRWWLCILRDPSYRNLELGAVPIPKGPFDRIFGTGRSSLINARGEHVEEALAFLEYLHGPDWNQLVDKQADALGSVRKYHYGEYEETFLHNPDHPEEDYNAVWRTALETAIPEWSSPFVSGQLADRVMLKQTDLMRSGVKSGAEAMRAAAREINKAIVEQLRLDPDLHLRYQELVARGAPKAWDNEADAP